MISNYPSLAPVPYELRVAMGGVSDTSSVIVFGYNQDVDTTEESVWPDGGIVPHTATATTMSVSSTSASDASAGVGARTVYISGLDGSYNVVSETVTLNGTTAVTTSNSYLAINDMQVMSVGSTGYNVGDINIGTGTVTLGVPAVLYDLIGAGNNSRTTGHYTVPAGYTGYLTQGVFTAGQAVGTTSVIGKLKVIGIDLISRVGAVITLNNGFSDYNFDIPLRIPEKTSISATAQGSANNNGVSTMFVICLMKN